MRLHWQVAANIAMHILLMEADRSALEVEKEIMFEICPTTSFSLQASKQKQQCLGKKKIKFERLVKKQINSYQILWILMQHSF